MMAVVAAVLLMSAAAATGSHAQATISAGVDTDTSGNSATAVGEIDTCVAPAVGDTFSVDVFVQDIPERSGETGGLNGFSYNVAFNPDILEITSIDNEFLLTSGGDSAPLEFVDADGTGGSSLDPFPATTGNLRVDYGDAGPNYESGDGVLSRLEVRAKAAGESALKVLDYVDERATPNLIQGAPLTISYPVGTVYNAVVLVGGSCEATETPTPYIAPDGGGPGTIDDVIDITPTPAGTGTGSEPTPTPGDGGTGSTATGSTTGLPSLAVDILPSGNDATSVGEIDDCAAADEGETFQVDIVIQDVEDLLAWEIALSYDPNVLEVHGRDVKLFQASNPGSSVIDQSASVPENTGRYVLVAVDSADPLNPESGDGVLARVTLKAIGEGTSPVEIKKLDLDNNGSLDQGVFLRSAVDNAVIGDTEGDDTLFDGPADGGEVRVGSECPGSNAHVENAPTATEGPSGDGDDDDGTPILLIILACLVVLGALGAGLFVYLRRRGAA